VSNWDGLYLNTYINRFVYFLVHDEVFKYRFRQIIAADLLGQIRRGKTKNDIGPLKKLIDLGNSGKCLGIFPEGDISYTGKSLEINKSISKLSKILNMPIVLVRIDGATYARPRWTYETRKYPVKITLTDVISAEDVKNLSVDTLLKRIESGIYYNDNEYQKLHRIEMKAKKPAEKLEYVLFLCPDCGKINCMVSQGEYFYCRCCGYKVKYNKYNQFELICGKNHLLNIEQWDEYQKGRLKDVINGCRENEEILSFDGFSYYKAQMGDFFYKSLCVGTLSLNSNRLKFVSSDGNFTEEYPVGQIEDLYIQFKGAVEFSNGNYRYRFISTKGQHYGYWFECFINTIKDIGIKRN
jgi:1-acyl-sn-glycerol-3-phosphate acyltransferase